MKLLSRNLFANSKFVNLSVPSTGKKVVFQLDKFDSYKDSNA